MVVQLSPCSRNTGRTWHYPRWRRLTPCQEETAASSQIPGCLSTACFEKVRKCGTPPTARRRHRSSRRRSAQLDHAGGAAGIGEHFYKRVKNVPDDRSCRSADLSLGRRHSPCSVPDRNRSWDMFFRSRSSALEMVAAAVIRNAPNAETPIVQGSVDDCHGRNHHSRYGRRLRSSAG